jgi:thymidylate synthase (FAD)
VAEDMYIEMLGYGVKPEMARSVLPTCLKTEIVMTAPMYEWEYFFNLRMIGTTGIPHPMIKKLSTMAYGQIKEKFYGNDKN